MFLSRIDRYILLQLIGVFGFFTLILVVIYWVNRAVGLLDSLIGDGQSVGVFLQMSLLTVPSVLELIAPMAGFGAGVFVVNRLRADSEMVVLQALGFSYTRLARPALAFGVVVAALTAVVSNGLLPLAAGQLRQMNTDISRDVTAKLLKDQQFMKPEAGIVLYFRRITPEGELQDIFISDNRDPVTATIYTAKRSYLVGDGAVPKLLMQDGMVQRNDPARGRVTVSRFDDTIYALDGLAPSGGGGLRGAFELSTLELLRAGAQAQQETGQSAAGLRYWGHLRLSWPISAALTAIIGFVSLFLGGFDRQGLRWQMAAAVVLLILLYLVHIVTMAYAPAYQNGWVMAYATPLVGAWLAALVLWRSGRVRRLGRRAGPFTWAQAGARDGMGGRGAAG
jgi:lipopolysaccharide export system permease protein